MECPACGNHVTANLLTLVKVRPKPFGIAHVQALLLPHAEESGCFQCSSFQL